MAGSYEYGGQRLKIEYEGLEAFKKAMAKKSTHVKVDLPKLVKEVTKDAQSLAQELVPKRTGTLRNSIDIGFSDGGLVGVLLTQERYAGFVEFGTKKHGGAQPYMRPAQTKARQALIDECLRLVKE